MNIDEPWRDHLIADVDNPRSRFRDRWRDMHDRIASNGNIALVPRAAAAINDPAVAQYQVVRGCLSGENCDTRQEAQRHDDTMAHRSKTQSSPQIEFAAARPSATG